MGFADLLHRRAETLPPTLGKSRPPSVESGGTPPRAGTPADDVGQGTAVADPPRLRNGLTMHANSSVPILRSDSQMSKSSQPSRLAADDLSLDRLKLADNRAPGMPPPQRGASDGHVRNNSGNSTTSSKRGQPVPLGGGADRPNSVGSFGADAAEDPYGGVGDDGASQYGNHSVGGLPPPMQYGQGQPYQQGPPYAGPSHGGYPGDGAGAPAMYPHPSQGYAPGSGLPPGPGGFAAGPRPMGPPGGYYPGGPQPGLPGQPHFLGGLPPPPGQMGYPGGPPFGQPGTQFDPQGQSLHRAGSSASSGPPAGPYPGLSRASTVSAQAGPPSQPGRVASDTSSTSPRPMISKASIDEYRNRIKNDPDPEAHFNYAKFLIEAAKKLASGNAAGDDKAIKKYRDALLQESLKLIRRLATQGVGLGQPAYAEAQFFLANCLGNGSLGLQVDHEKAYYLYVQASKQDHAAATYRTAVCNELGAGTRKKDSERAARFYCKAASLDDTAGMYKWGMILLRGLLEQKPNPKDALVWLQRAASQANADNPHAVHELALLYETPLVISTTASNNPNQPSLPPGSNSTTLVPRDEAYARELFTHAAQLGYAPSQNKLGSCYEYGSLTCPIDPRRSIAWYTRAAERGDSESELALSGWYLTGSEGVLKQSDSEAYLWARRAANKGLAKAEYAVGYYSEVGIGVKQDLDEAKRWYMRSAAQGNKRAMQRLTELKKMGAQKPGKVRPTREQTADECIIS